MGVAYQWPPGRKPCFWKGVAHPQGLFMTRRFTPSIICDMFVASPPPVQMQSPPSGELASKKCASLLSSPHGSRRGGGYTHDLEISDTTNKIQYHSSNL